MEHTYSIVVGDWSDDGHGKCDKFIFKCTHTKAEIIKAYRGAVKKSGVALEDGTKGKNLVLLNDYQDGVIPAEAIEKLKSIGCKFDWTEDAFDEEEGLGCSPSDVFHLFLEMVQTQLADFKYDEIGDEIESINGYWDKNFNESMGYGVYE